MAAAESGPPITTSVADNELPRLFQCNTCKRSFTRVDHLTRHVRAHTRQKPYVCPTCSKGFARVDLLKRHVAGHTVEQSNKRQKHDTARPSRVIQACEACAQNHLRCEDDKPCSRCRKRKLPCRTALPENFTQPEPEEDTVSAAQGLLDFSNNFDRSTMADEMEPSASSMTEDQISAGTDVQSSENHLVDSEVSMTSYEDSASQYPHHIDVMDHSSFNLDHSHLMPLEEPFFSGQCTPRGIMDASFNWDIDLNDFDIGFLDQYSLDIPFNVETPSTDAHGPEPAPMNLPPEGVAVRHEAFKRSIWRYIPQSNRDFGGAEQPNLALDNAHHRPRAPPRRAIQERLGRVTRDKLLAFVLSTCSPVNVSRIASAFPSAELLDGLIQYFLTSPSLDAKSWFHLPTFSPTSLRPELLAIVIAAGAISTPDVPLCKLGFALHEASRAGSSIEFERDNTAIRDFQSIQTLLILLEIGMWSGISRKMEISESFMQPLVTMLRRGGRFRRSTWKQICPHPEDTGLTLDTKWKEWVAEESYLRLVYRAFEHDRQSSMALLKPPLISYSEMQLPLTHPEPIWQANTADMWKMAYLSNPQTSNRPSPMECLSDLELLSLHEMASSAYVYMAWGMIWNFRQMSTLSSQSPLHRAKTVHVSSRHQELTRFLEDFRVSSPMLALSSGSTVEIVLELMLIHLNAPLEEIQLYAGIEGQEEARRVLPVLKRWIETSSARQALWHSGQVLRTAAKLPRGLLRNFNAIAVYHAGLILWGYGLLKPNTLSPANEEGQCIYINGMDNIQVRRFITLDRGFPALLGQAGEQSPVPLMDTEAVMNSLVHLLHANHDAKDGSNVPLVDNLVHLMEGLKPAKS